MSSYVPPPPPTVWDFVKVALERHQANRVRMQRQQARQAPNPLDGDTGIAAMHRMAERERQQQANRDLDQQRSGIGDAAENLNWMFAPPPVVVKPKATGRRKYTPLQLGPPPLPHELLNTPTRRTPIAGPTRFPGGGGIHHEYTYAAPSSTVFIHVHRTGGGYATKAHSKDGRFKFIVGKGQENDISLGQLALYGIKDPDRT